MTDASDVKSAASMQQSLRRRAPLLFWVRRPANRDGQAACRNKQLSTSVAGTDKLGILSKAQLFDHIGCNVLRFQDADLTFDPGRIRRRIAAQGVCNVTAPSAARS